MTNEEIMESQRKWKAFAETDIGKLYIAFRNATQRYWQQDANENISDRRLCELADAERKAADAFIARLMADYGVI